MSPNTGKSQQAANNRRFKLVAVGLALTVGFVVPEVLVRLFHTDQASYDAIRFGGDANSARLFVKDPDLHWALRKSASVQFLGHQVLTNARGFRIATADEEPDGAAHVLCVGDSTTFGWSVPGQSSFPAVLEQNLREQMPDEHWVVHNAGVPGYSSHQMWLSAKRWLPVLRPKVVVICIGNNDAWPARRSDLQAEETGLAATISRVLRKSAFFSWAASKLRNDKQPENPRYFANDSVPRVSDNEMATNLKAVIDLARLHNVQALILGAPANLHSPPRNMNSEIARFRELGDQIYREIEAKHAEAATKLADEALAKEPENVYLKWLRAMVTANAIDPGIGRSELEEVFEGYRFPDRARGSYRQRQQKVAEQAGTPFVDVNKLFLIGRSTEDAKTLYVDWCHPTSKGHRLIARQLTEWITQ